MRPSQARLLLVKVVRFERTASHFQSERSDLTELHPVGTEDRNRTCNALQRLVLSQMRLPSFATSAWSGQEESNFWPLESESSALPG